MAKVKEVHTCRACSAVLFKVDQAICHECGYRLNFTEGGKFETPDYLFYQRDGLVIELDAKSRDYQKNIEGIDADLVNFIKKSAAEDKVAALYDAFYHIKFLILSGADQETVKHVVKVGKLIGKLSNSIDEYIKNQGGIHVSGRVGSSEDTDDEESIRYS